MFHVSPFPLLGRTTPRDAVDIIDSRPPDAALGRRSGWQQRGRAEHSQQHRFRVRAISRFLTVSYHAEMSRKPFNC